MPNAIRNWRRRVMMRMQGPESDRGASAIEYAGIVIIVAAIILAIRGLGLNTAISAGIAKAVNSILGN